MKKILSFALVASLTACGGGNEEEAQQQAESLANQLGEQMQAAADQAAEQAAAPAEAPAAAADGASNFGTITLVPGFTPDPHTATGTSGGTTDAATMNAACAGNVSGTPDHLFVASAAFANLRIMAKSDVDITLVVQKPDGSFLCDDDTDGTNPVVAGEFAPGTYKIWIGSYDAEANGRYTLGVSELADVMPSAL